METNHWKILDTQGDVILSALRKDDLVVFKVGMTCTFGGHPISNPLDRIWISHNQLRGDFGRMGSVLADEHDRTLLKPLA